MYFNEEIDDMYNEITKEYYQEILQLKTLLSEQSKFSYRANLE